MIGKGHTPRDKVEQNFSVVPHRFQVSWTPVWLRRCKQGHMGCVIVQPDVPAQADVVASNAAHVGSYPPCPSSGWKIISMSVNTPLYERDSSDVHAGWFWLDAQRHFRFLECQIFGMGPTTLT